MGRDLFASILLDVAIDKELDYLIEQKWQEAAQVGMRVRVPLRGREAQGTIVSLKEIPSWKNPEPILELLTDLVIPQELLKTAEWISRYYAAPLRKVLAILFPSSVKGKIGPKMQLFVRPLKSRPEMVALSLTLLKKAPTQAKVLEVLLKAHQGILLTELLEKSGAHHQSIVQLEKKGVLHSAEVRIDRSPIPDAEYFPTRHKILGAEQQAAFDAIATSLEGAPATHLLFGVTGSGKTEIYLQAIQKALDSQKGSLFLVPEIALTSQMIEQLKTRFREKIALLHHRLSAGERHDMWHAIRSGECSIVVGARSAIFSPVKNLGLIIVDEEHDGAYKNEESPCYSARDAAIVRGKFAQATVILGSATPSLESYFNALKGKYQLHSLKARAGSARLPAVRIIDMKLEFEKRKGFTLFSDVLLSGIKARASLGEQTLLFLNRRGYHTAQTCLSCSHVMQCPHCSVSLTFHLGERLLSCHLCGYTLSPPPQNCPKCHKSDTMKYKGAGTEMVEKALHALLPEIRTLRVDADTTRHKGSHELLFRNFRAGKADVLIGTQMVVKGHHFPSTTLVGILNSDASLNIPDFRSAESVFQLIAQVAGRAGRGALPGEVIIQTHLPEHPSIDCAAHHDFVRFYTQEMQTRELFSFPPHTHLVKLLLSSTTQEKALRSAQQLRTHFVQTLPPIFQILPVIPCGKEKIKDRYRFQFLIKGENVAMLGPLFKQIPPIDKEVRLLIDVDPSSTFF